jgi:hypothetical protein
LCSGTAAQFPGCFEMGIQTANSGYEDFPDTLSWPATRSQSERLATRLDHRC